jgi:type I restriction enzyme S subunit
MASELAISDFPDSWVITTLGKMLDESGGKVQTGPFGSQLHASDYVDIGIPSVMPKNIFIEGIDETDIARITKEDANRLSKYLLKEGDIVYSRRGDVEKCSLVTREENGWLCGTGCLRVRLGDNSLISPKFLHAYLSSPVIREWISRNAIGATMPNLNTTILRDVPLLIPTQEHIFIVANMWQSLNSKIKLNQQTNQTLEKMAQALFKSWFVDFDPVIDNALAAGNTIPGELQHRALLRQKQHRKIQAQPASKPNVKPLPHDIQQIFPSEFEHCGDPSIGIAGWIPKGWSVSNTGKEFEVLGGGTPSTKNPEFWDGGDICWTSPKDLSGNETKILLDTSRKITNMGLKKISSGMLPIGTVLMSSRAPVGYLALAKVPVAINQGYIALKCNKTLSSEYTIQLLDSLMDEIKGIAGGTTFAEISKKTFKSIKLVVPTKPVVVAFTSIVVNNYEKITANIKQINSLTETRDYLLPKLISGEVPPT